MRKIWSYYNPAFVVVFFVSILINIFTIYDGHNWGGDFSQFILHALNIVESKGYTSDIMLDLHIVYPPGFPLILAPWIKLFGVNFIILKCLNIVFWYGTILLAYPLIKDNVSQRLASYVCILLSVSYEFFIFKQNVLSDLPFLFFLTASIFLFIRYIERVNQPRVIYVLLTVVTMAVALFIRSAGAALFVATIFYLGPINRRWLLCVWFLAGMAATFLLQGYLIGVHFGYFELLFAHPDRFLIGIIENFDLVFNNIFVFFIPNGMLITQKIFLMFKSGSYLLSLLIVIVIICKFFKGVRGRDLSFLASFLCIYLLMITLWAGTHYQILGYTRYVLPVLVPIIILIAKAVSLPRLPQWVRNVPLVGIVISIFFNLINIGVNYQSNDDVLLRKDNVEMFEWVKTHLDEDQHFMIWQTKVITLMTNRVGTTPIKVSNQSVDFFDRINEFYIDYVILTKAVDQSFIQGLQSREDMASQVFENKVYKIFKIKEI